MLWGCQPVAFMRSARVAPVARRIRSRIFALLLPARPLTALAARGLRELLFADLRVFFDAVRLGADFLVWSAVLLADARLGAGGAPGPFGTAAFSAISELVMWFRSILSARVLRMTIHPSCPAEKQDKTALAISRKANTRRSEPDTTRKPVGPLDHAPDG